MSNKTNKEQTAKCPEFPFFGARYPDARCIDGFLWDLDSYENGGLTSGGDQACPFCNTEEAISQNIDEENGITRELLITNINALKEKYR